MKKRNKVSMLLACVCALCVGIGTRMVAQPVSAEEETPTSYGLYTSEVLAQYRSGKTMSLITGQENSKIEVDTSGAVNGGTAISSNHSTCNATIRSDTDYDPSNKFGAPNGGKVTWNLTYGLSEFAQVGYPGPVWRYWEFELTDAIDTAIYDMLTVEIGVQEVNNDGVSADKSIEARLLVYGSNGTSDVTAAPVTFYFGADFFTQGRVDLTATGLTNIKRIAIGVNYATYDNTFYASNDYILFGGWKVHAKQAVAEEVSLTANEQGYAYHTGGCMNGVITAKAHSVYYTNGNLGYAQFSGFSDKNECVYGTERMYAGKYVLLTFSRPVKVSEYKYFYLEILPYAQIADGDWLKEDATKFYFDVLPYDATDDTAATERLTANRQSWTTCRISLTELADNEGYVSRLILKYAATNKSGERDETKYSIQFGSHDGLLSNDANEPQETYVASIEKPVVGENEISLTLNLAENVEIGESLSESMKTGIAFNGKTLSELETAEKLSVLVSENTITLNILKSEFLLNGKDTLTVAKDTVVKENIDETQLKLIYDETFTYDHILNRFELARDMTDVASSVTQVSIECVETGGEWESAENGKVYNQVVVTFSYYVARRSFRPIDVESDTTATEKLNFERYRYGIVDSVMDYMYINGKSVREWMQLDAINGNPDEINIRYMGGDFNRGKCLYIRATAASSLNLGADDEDMTLELKKGYTTPMLREIGKDLLYSIDSSLRTEKNKYFSIVASELPEISPEVEVEEYNPVAADGSSGNGAGSGCAANLGVATVLPTMLALAASGFVKAKRKGGKKE